MDETRRTRPPADELDREPPPWNPKTRKTSGRSGVRLGAVIALAAVAAVVAWLAIRHFNGNSTPTPKNTISATSPVALKSLSGTLGPIYWAGTQANTKYELTQTPDGRVFVRYLPKDAEIGTNTPYLFVATFPVQNAYQATQTAAGAAGAVKLNAGPNAIAFYSRATPTNVYLAFNGANQQVEVFSPNAAEARRLVTGKKIRTILASQSPKPSSDIRALSLHSVEALPNKLGKTLYWAGRMAGVKYEVTQTAGGRVFVRYLPSSETVGSSNPYTFIGTFPVTNAYSVTLAAAKAEGSVRVPITGGVAFYSAASPTNIYVAHPGEDVQVEVFDPDPAHARTLVTSGLVRQIP